MQHRRWPEGQLSSRADSLSPTQSASAMWGLYFSAMRDGNEPRDVRSGSCVVGDVETWQYILSGNGQLSSPGSAGHRLARRAILSVRWLHEPPPTTNQLVELGVPHHAGLYRLERSPH